MKRQATLRTGLLAFASLGWLLTGCAADRPAGVFALEAQSGFAARPAIAVTTPLWPLPSAGLRRYVATPGGGDVGGSVGFLAVTDAFFRNSAAAYQVAAMPAHNALITLSTLEEELYARGSEVVGGLSEADGAFQIQDLAPLDHPFLVNAILAQGHRLSAITHPNVTSLALDEATSMVAELARWQIRSAPTAAGQRSLEDLTPEALAALTDLTRPYVQASDFAATDGPVPNVPLLKQGAGLALRNHYVQAFGSGIAAGAAASSANQLSDAWKALLGFRPLALTLVAGNGSTANAQGDGGPAGASSLINPTDAVTDSAGNLYITERNPGRVRIVPAADRGPTAAFPAGMLAGHVYTLAGAIDAPSSVDFFNSIYSGAEAAAVAEPLNAPPLFDPVNGTFPLIAPQRIIVETDGAATHLYVTSPSARRVFFIPGADLTGRYGRNFKANRLYTLVGFGEVPGSGYVPTADDGQPGHGVVMASPGGMVRDGVGNLYVVDSGAGVQSLRVLRQSDGRLFTLPLTLGGPLPLGDGDGYDLRIHDGYLYVVLRDRHAVVRCALPDVAALSAGSIVPLTATVVLGVLDQPGFLAPGTIGPVVQDLSKGFPQADARLTSPTSIAFDPEGHLIVAESRRMRLLTSEGLDGAGGLVSLIAGGFETAYSEGDSRLAEFKASTYLHAETTGNLLVTDFSASVVRRLWTARGAK